LFINTPTCGKGKGNAQINLPFTRNAAILTGSRTEEQQDIVAISDLGNPEVNQAAKSMVESNTAFMNFLGPVWICLQNRRVFRTAAGRLGFGSISVKEGDSICVFDGAPTTHVIRPLNYDRGSAYGFVGEAYVHGMMNGQIEDLGLDVQNIVLI
jgi:hypothetical protein